MSPDDPRHGTYAGWQAHRKTNHPVCDPCHTARSRYFKTMKYRLHTVGPERVPLGDRAWHVIDSMGRRELSRITGLRDSYLSRLHGRGPQAQVYRRTKATILDAGTAVTPLGVQRRLQALLALGYSGAVLSKEVGVSVDAMRGLLRSPEPRKYHPHRVTAAVLDLYERLQLAPMPTGASATAARNKAARMGFAPPMAWDDIDDPHENPTNWEYRPGERADLLRELDAHQVGITEACRRLDVAREALQQWCLRNNASDIYHRLVTREKYTPNGTIGAA